MIFAADIKHVEDGDLPEDGELVVFRITNEGKWTFGQYLEERGVWVDHRAERTQTDKFWLKDWVSLWFAIPDGETTQWMINTTTEERSHWAKEQAQQGTLERLNYCDSTSFEGMIRVVQAAKAGHKVERRHQRTFEWEEAHIDPLNNPFNFYEFVYRVAVNDRNWLELERASRVEEPRRKRFIEPTETQVREMRERQEEREREVERQAELEQEKRRLDAQSKQRQAKERKLTGKQVTCDVCGGSHTRAEYLMTDTEEDNEWECPSHFRCLECSEVFPLMLKCANGLCELCDLNPF